MHYVLFLSYKIFILLYKSMKVQTFLGHINIGLNSSIRIRPNNIFTSNNKDLFLF